MADNLDAALPLPCGMPLAFRRLRLIFLLGYALLAAEPQTLNEVRSGKPEAFRAEGGIAAI